MIRLLGRSLWCAVVFALLVACQSDRPATPAPATPAIAKISSACGGAPTKYVFLIDTSGSMEGRGDGHTVIFPEVKEQVIGFLQDLCSGDIVHIRTFDQGIQLRHRFNLASPEGRENALAHVRNLVADGTQTWVYRSVLETAEDLREEADASGGPTIFYVITDGHDNDPQGMTMEEMINAYDKIRGIDDYLIWMTLGIDLPEKDKQPIRKCPHCELQPQPDSLIRIATIQVRPRLIDFGYVEEEVAPEQARLAAKCSSPRVMIISTAGLSDSSEVRLHLTADFPAADSLGAAFEVRPSTVDIQTAREIRLCVFNSEPLLDSQFSGKLTLSAQMDYATVIPKSIPAKFTTSAPPVPPRCWWCWIVWGLAILIALWLIAVVIRIWNRGEPFCTACKRTWPLSIWRQNRPGPTD